MRKIKKFHENNYLNSTKSCKCSVYQKQSNYFDCSTNFQQNSPKINILDEFRNKMISCIIFIQNLMNLFLQTRCFLVKYTKTPVDT